MTRKRFLELTGRYPSLRVVVCGDFCLDRYFDIDPARTETSIETGRPVHNVTGVRCYAGAAGTIVNNLVALGVGEIRCVGFSGDDGEGWELRRALTKLRGVRLDHFLTTPDRQTFTYSKPLVQHPGRPPEELNRLDQKNWTVTPTALQARLAEALSAAAEGADAVILLEQVDLPNTGVVARSWFEPGSPVRRLLESKLVFADSRNGLSGWPAVIFKMNAAELGHLTGSPAGSLPEVQAAAAQLANRNQRPVYITLAERGIVSAAPGEAPVNVAALPVGPVIDVVGAGDSVTANLASARGAGATARESMELAMAAANTVIHQLGTTGIATPQDLEQKLAGRWSEA
jgi:rfaE bifunctional protein kinase chain/domain